MAGAQLHRRHNPTSRSAREIEIEPGRRVPNTWDEFGPHLLERYAERSARLQRERALAAEAERELAALRGEASDEAHHADRLAAVLRRQDAAAAHPAGFGACNGH